MVTLSPFPPSNAKSESEPLLPRTVPVPSDESAHATHLKGLAYIVLSTLGYSTVSVLVRVAEETYDYPATASVFLRGLVLLFLTSFSLLATLDLPRVATSLTPNQWAALLLRGCTGAVSVWCQYAAFKYMPAGEVISIFAINPMLTLAVSRIFLGEPTTAFDALASMLGVSGVALIVNPNLPFAVDSDASPQRTLGAALALSSAFLSAFSYVSVRSLGSAVPFMLSVSSLSVCTLILTLTYGFFTDFGNIIRGGPGAAVILLASLFSFLGQSGLCKGLQLSPAGPASIIRNVDVPLVYLLGMLFLGERPSLVPSLGSALVVISALLVGLRRLLRQRHV